MRTLIFLIGIQVLLFACSRSTKVSDMALNIPNHQFNINDFNRSFKKSKTEIYDSIYSHKKIQFFETKRCDENELDSSIPRKKFFFDSCDISSKYIDIKVRFVNECCQKFGGDFRVIGSTLLFTIENLNNRYCPCYCCYHYQLKITGDFQRVKRVKFQFISANTESKK